MERRNSNVGGKVKEFFTSLGRRKFSASEKSLEASMVQVTVEEENLVKTTPRTEITEVTPEETPSTNVLSSDSFRADDILRSKLSTEESFTLPPLLQSLAPKLPPEKGTPTTLKSPNFPQIIPPAFSPVVSLKHITPFEHAEKPMFRTRQSSAPPPRSDSTTRRSPSPPQNPPPERQKMHPHSMPIPRSTYSWDSWERPQFQRVPGCLPFSGDSLPENREMNGYQPSKNGNIEQQPSLLTLYYDFSTGQYIPGPDYRTHGRYATIGGYRHRSRRHHHNNRSVENYSNRSVGNYSTYDHARSASLMSGHTPEQVYPAVEQGSRGVIQFQQPTMYSYVVQTPTFSMPTSPRDQQMYHPMVESMHHAYSGKKHLVSSGTDDTPIQVDETIERTPRRPAKLRSISVAPVNATYVESSPPVFVPQTMVYRHISQPPPQPLAPIKPDQEEHPIRYTSDVVRSINRQAFKIGQKGSIDGALSPRDHYLEVISNGVSKPSMRETSECPKGRLNSESESKPSVKDLVKKFSRQSADDVFVRNSRNDFNNKEESRNGNYVEDGTYPFRR
nr:expressed protein [Hymenolepis microstoma]